MFFVFQSTNNDNRYFNGSSLARLDLLRDPISALRETIRFRFKTTHLNGVLLYSCGTQGDYIAIQLKENRLVLNINELKHSNDTSSWQIVGR